MSERIFLICSVMLLSLLIEAPNANSKEGNKQILDKLQGEWLNKTYVEILSKTRSPMKAVGGYVTGFKISKSNGAYEWLQMYGFHESIHRAIQELTPMIEKNTYLVKDNERNSGVHGKFIIKNKGTINKLVWINGNSGKKDAITFMRVKPTIEDYINRAVLVGNYKDINGRNFTFSESGESKWPDKAFKYKINLDYEGVNCDMFTVLDGEGVIGYGFVWQAGRLFIFNLKEEETIHCDKDPLVILIPG